MKLLKFWVPVLGTKMVPKIGTSPTKVVLGSPFWGTNLVLKTGPQNWKKKWPKLRKKRKRNYPTTYSQRAARETKTAANGCQDSSFFLRQQTSNLHAQAVPICPLACTVSARFWNWTSKLPACVFQWVWRQLAPLPDSRKRAKL